MNVFSVLFSGPSGEYYIQYHFLASCELMNLSSVSLTNNSLRYRRYYSHISLVVHSISSLISSPVNCSDVSLAVKIIGPPIISFNPLFYPRVQ